MQDLLVLNKLKDVTETIETFPYSMKVLFNIIRSMNLKKLDISADALEIKPAFEFNPTITLPNIQLIDKFKKQFSIWYKPTVYLPRFETAKPIVLDFVILKGMQNSLYNFSESFQKELSTYKSFSKTELKNISIKMLSQLNEIKLLLFVRCNVIWFNDTTFYHFCRIVFQKITNSFLIDSIHAGISRRKAGFSCSHCAHTSL